MTFTRNRASLIRITHGRNDSCMWPGNIEIVEGEKMINKEYGGLELKEIICKLQGVPGATLPFVSMTSMYIIMKPEQVQSILEHIEKTDDLNAKEVFEFVQQQPEFEDVIRLNAKANKIKRIGPGELLLTHRAIQAKAAIDLTGECYVGYVDLDNQRMEFNGKTEDEVLDAFKMLADQAMERRLEKDADVRKRQLTIEEFEQMDDDYCELINGHLFPQKVVLGHASLINEIKTKLLKVRDSNRLPYSIHSQRSHLYCDEKNIFLPDIMIVRDTSETDNNKERVVPEMVIEVMTEHTVMLDLIEKKEVYMNMGVPEYWVINPYTGVLFRYTREDRKLMFFSKPYDMKLPFYSGKLKLADVWKKAEKLGLLRKKQDSIQWRKNGTNRSFKEFLKEQDFIKVLDLLTNRCLITQEEASEMARSYGPQSGSVKKARNESDEEPDCQKNKRNLGGDRSVLHPLPRG